MPSAPRPALPSWFLLALVGVVGLVGLWAAAVLPGEQREDRHLRELRSALGGMRAAGPRLSVTPRYRACGDEPGIVPRSSCAPLPRVASPDRGVLKLSARAAAAVRVELDAAALHRAGLVDLLWSGEGGIRLDAAISSLEHAVRLAEHPAPVLADLAGAFLLRAERDQSPLDVLRALEAAERALAEEPKNEVAAFNRAMALERIGLARAAREAWGAYHAADPRSGWGVEAGERAQALVPPEAPVPPAEPDTAAAAAFAAEAPQEALMWGLETALGGWGEAVLAGDEAKAARWLAAAEAAGARLVRDGRDASLADAAGAARESAGAGRVQLVRDHQAFAEVARLFENDRPLEAAPLLRRMDSSSPPLAGFTRLYRAMLLGFSHDRIGALGEALALVASADSLRHPALAARARWVAGTMAWRGGRAEEALHWYLAARPLLERAEWVEGSAGLASMLTATRMELGQQREALVELRRGLRMLQGREGSVWMHNLLLMAIGAAEEEGWTRVSLLLMGEAALIAAMTKRPHLEAEARLTRARGLAALGERKAADAEVAYADRAIVRIASAEKRAWFGEELRIARGALLLGEAPARAVVLLDSAVAALGAEPARQVAALVVRAEARLASGDLDGATADLARASEIVHAEVETVESVPLRRGTAERARRVWDRLVMARVAAGAAGEALARLERGRAAFSVGAGPDASAPRMAPGEGALSYAVIGDTLLVWALRGDSVHLARATVSRAELVRTVERARTALELHAGDDAVRADLARLYDWLVRPVQRWLPPAGAPLQVVADGEVAAVPFAALFDDRRGRFLVEDHPLRLAARLGGRRGESAAGVAVMVVADPAFDPAAHAGLGRLAGAAEEAREVAAAWGGATVVVGEDASRERLRAALPRASVFHYAGHAVFDDARPERSYLVLAGDGAARLTADDVEGMDLGGVRLVVLSACETLRAADGRAGGFAGFAGALLRAGAGGVVGSTWRVEDEATRRLMVDFHQRYRATGDGARALREAQLSMLRSSDPAYRPAAAWAAFRYAGR